MSKRGQYISQMLLVAMVKMSYGVGVTLQCWLQVLVHLSQQQRNQTHRAVCAFTNLGIYIFILQYWLLHI